MINSDHTADAFPWSAYEEWQTEKLGNILYLEYGAGLSEPQRLSGEFPVYGSNGQVGRHKTFLVEGPGIIVGRKGSIGAVLWSSDSFWPIDTTYYVLVKGDCDLRWCYWLLLSLPLNRLDSSTGVPGLNRNDAYELLVKVPPSREEQHYIAQILDIMDTQIQEAEKLIAKLKQMRTGLLHELLTRGIDENGELRDPVAYPEQFKEGLLGKLPIEWRTDTLIEVAKGGISNGIFKKPERVGSGYPLVNVLDLYRDFGIDLNSVERINISKQEWSRYAIQAGDCFFTRSSLNLAGIAHCNVIREVPEPALFEGHLMRVRPEQSKVVPEFLAYWCRSPQARRYFMSRAKQVTMTTISQPDIAPLPVPLPLKPEQIRIVELMDSYETRVRSEEANLNKLKQIKKGLVHDLLTGRVRVTQLAADDEE